jgi:hypothetical protein
MARIHVHRPNHYFPDSSLENRIGAWRREPDCGTGLECNKERCPSRNVGAKIAQTRDLGVFVARPSVMSSCHYPIVHHQHGADSGIGARLALGFFGFLECLAHEEFISLHHRRHGQMDNCDRSLRQLFSQVGVGQAYHIHTPPHRRSAPNRRIQRVRNRSVLGLQLAEIYNLMIRDRSSSDLAQGQLSITNAEKLRKEPINYESKFVIRTQN